MDGPRPCPYVSCRYHLFDEVVHRLVGVTRDEVRKVSDERLVEALRGMEYSCALDWAAKGPNTLEQIGRMFGVTRERVRQIQAMGLRKVKIRAGTRKRAIVELLEEMGTRGGMKEWK